MSAVVSNGFDKKAAPASCAAWRNRSLLNLETRIAAAGASDLPGRSNHVQTVPIPKTQSHNHEGGRLSVQGQQPLSTRRRGDNAVPLSGQEAVVRHQEVRLTVDREDGAHDDARVQAYRHPA
jgi:hypothetical protein